MPTAQQILARKGRHVFTVSPEATVLDAALLMNEHKIGCLVALQDHHIVGILTERDLLRRIVARRIDPGEMLVRDVMTRQVACCQPDATLEEARNLIMHRRVRHLPVVNAAGQLQGLISIGDLNAWELTGQQIEIQYLHEYLYSRV